MCLCVDVDVGVCMYTHTQLPRKKSSSITTIHWRTKAQDAPKASVESHPFLHGEETAQALPGADKFTWPGELNPAWEIHVIKEPSPSASYQRAPC